MSNYCEGIDSTKVRYCPLKFISQKKMENCYCNKGKCMWYHKSIYSNMSGCSDGECIIFEHFLK